jgi:PIN domain nuclease of toxin-antitoxin system
MQYVIDTHALIWLLEDNIRLGSQAKSILIDPASQLVLPAIALAEAVWIVDRGRTLIPSSSELMKIVRRDLRVSIYPLNQAVIEKTITLLAINEMHDRQIVATGLVLQDQGQAVTLLTCDRNITAAQVISIMW